MRITLLPQRREVELPGRRRVREILRELGIAPGTVMVIRNNDLLTEEEVVEANDAIEIRSVISGGSNGAVAARCGARTFHEP